jgi:hemolysin D
MTSITRLKAVKLATAAPGEAAHFAPQRTFAPVGDRRSGDREFLPSALAVIEAPASPVRLRVIAAMVGLLASVMALSYFGHLEDFSTAAGKIQAPGRTKVVEPRETGQVTAIRVKGGDRVVEGAALVELDPTDAVASRSIIADKLLNVRAEMAGLRVELTSARAQAIDAKPVITWDRDIPSKVIEREEGVVYADLAQLSATLAELAQQRKAAEVLRDKFSANVVGQKNLIAVTSEHVAMDESLASQGWSSRLKVLEILEKLRQQQISLSTLQTGLADAEALIPVIDSQIVKARETFITNDTQSLASADRQLDELTQQLAKADQTLSDMTLRSPVTGVIQNVVVTTIGQVVTPGQQLMQVVPEGMPLEVIAYVDNTTVGFVRTGQRVDIKVKTFPYATYGTIPGIVTNVAKDAMPAEAKNTLQAAALDGEVSQSTAAQKTGNIVFPITVQPLRSTMNVDGKIIALSSGMQVSVDLKTERRRAIDYIASPLIELFTTAAHEQ